MFQVAGGSEIPVPHLPEGSTLEVEEEEGGKVVWKVVKDGQLVRIFVSFLSMPSFKVRILYFLSMFSLKVRKYDEEEIRFTVSAKFHLFRLEHE